MTKLLKAYTHMHAKEAPKVHHNFFQKLDTPICIVYLCEIFSKINNIIFKFFSTFARMF